MRAIRMSRLITLIFCHHGGTEAHRLKPPTKPTSEPSVQSDALPEQRLRWVAVSDSDEPDADELQQIENIAWAEEIE